MMMKFRIVLLALLCVPFFTKASDKEKYTIKFRVNGMKDTTCLLAYYYSNGTYIKDTLKIDGSGRCTYKGSLNKGLYTFVITDKNYFDLVVNNDYKFSMETSVVNPAVNMVIKGSPENELFYRYLHTGNLKFQEMQDYQKKMKQAEGNKDSASYYAKKIEEINKDLIAYKLDIVKKYPASFTTLMINTMREPEIPEIPTLPNGRKDSTFAYRYYRAHFWDGCDFTDDRVLRTPVFHNKLKKYFDEVLYQVPDTISREVDNMIEKCRPNPEMFKYMVWFTTYHYESSEIMGFDRVFVHIVDKYYVTGQTTWIDKETNEKIIKKANRIRPTLIGETAPNMIMLDTNNRWVALHNIKSKYLMILFWDPDCGHCEKEIPVIRDFYEQNKARYGIEVFSVCSDSSVVKWKNGIRKKRMNFINVDGPRTLTGDFHDQYDINSTPVIYLLDEQKKIIAKHLPPDKVASFFENYSKLHK